jgi:hypothetical protein
MLCYWASASARHLLGLSSPSKQRWLCCSCGFFKLQDDIMKVLMDFAFVMGWKASLSHNSMVLDIDLCIQATCETIFLCTYQVPFVFELKCHILKCCQQFNVKGLSPSYHPQA